MSFNANVGEAADESDEQFDDGQPLVEAFGSEDRRFDNNEEKGVEISDSLQIDIDNQPVTISTEDETVNLGRGESYSRKMSFPNGEKETNVEVIRGGGDNRSVDPGNDGGKPKTKQSPALFFGTLVVIGAVATNVIGFRHSRFAVGKDVHRAWKNYERAAAKRQYETAAREHQRASSTGSTAGWAGGQQRQQSSQEQQRVRWQEEAERMRQDEELRRARVRSQQTQADRQAREATRNRFRTWEQTTTTSRDGRRTTRTTYENVRVDIDPNLFEALFGNRRSAPGGQKSSTRNPFGMPEDVLEELLRAAQQQTNQQFQQQQRNRGRNQQDFEFDAFQFWQHMNNSGGFHQGPGGPGGADQRFSRMGGSPFGNAGLSRHYSALGLKSGASDADIKAAYRREVMKWHPDKYRGSNKAEAERKFREVTEAYNVLTRK